MSINFPILRLVKLPKYTRLVCKIYKTKKEPLRNTTALTNYLKLIIYCKFLRHRGNRSLYYYTNQ